LYKCKGLEDHKARGQPVCPPTPRTILLELVPFDRVQKSVPRPGGGGLLAVFFYIVCFIEHVLVKSREKVVILDADIYY
jgi:hypothetical protein